MRVDSIVAINSQQPNSEPVFPVAKTSQSNTASGLLFQEYLKANLQNMNNMAIPRHIENQIAGLLVGHIKQLRISSRESSEPETIAY